MSKEEYKDNSFELKFVTKFEKDSLKVDSHKDGIQENHFVILQMVLNVLCRSST
jgi:hypothetical protein